MSATQKERAKVEPTPSWPIIAGSYVVGDPKGCIAICTLASEDICQALAKLPQVAIVGPCKTENVGIERIVLNVVSNINIRFLMICGAEVVGHAPGGTLKALHQNGIDPSTKRIRGAPGAIPYIEHLTLEAVERFRRQVRCIDMVGVEDVNQIRAKVEELATQDPGAYSEPPLIIEFEKRIVEEIAMPVPPLTPSILPSMTVLSALVEEIKIELQLIEKSWLKTAVSTTRARGIVTGIILALLLSILAYSLLLGG
jgi:tetrahydromethanopterin S-methyltransferase subunit A